MHRAPIRAALTAAVAVLALAGCSTIGTGSGGDSTDSTGDGRTGGTVVLATHESFSLPKELIQQWEEETGYRLEVRAAGDAGTLATKLSLTADNPIADAAFGIDNTFASRPVGEGAFASYEPTLPAGAEAYALDEDADLLTPIDTAGVCLNVDLAWFEREGLEPPSSLADIATDTYGSLTVLPGATTSSPGMAFLLTTIAEQGEDWPDYWQQLMEHDVKVVDGWEDAYYGDFTAGSKTGTRPVTLSYDSSPAFTVKDGKTTTAALLDTCFRQVEYAGVLAGAKNPEGAEALVDWLLSDEVQSALPDSMYVFPVSQGADVPQDWARFAEQPSDPYEVAPDEIAANREQWLTEWTDVVTR